MVLVVSSRTDEHATAVLAELARLGVPNKLAELNQFPSLMRLEMRYSSADKRDFKLTFPDGSIVNMDECRSIWWRRPQQFEVDPRIVNSGHRSFCFNECSEAFRGLWQSVDVFWVNNPARDDIAHRKAFQLRVAQEVGLRVPETIITNDPTAATAFIESNGSEKTIYKAFSATEEDWRETRLVRKDEMRALHNVRHAPVIFQEYIDARHDLRITVVGRNIFAAAIHSQESAYKVDFRMDVANTRIEQTLLPQSIQKKLHALMKRLGLEYGAIDMRLTPDDQYVFLEINPAGQWLFIEQRTRQPISLGIAKLLASAGRKLRSVPERH